MTLLGWSNIIIIEKYAFCMRMITILKAAQIKEIVNQTQPVSVLNASSNVIKLLEISATINRVALNDGTSSCTYLPDFTTFLTVFL